MCTSAVVCMLCLLTRCSFSNDEAAYCFVQSASDAFVPELKRGGGVPLFVDLTNMPFQSFEDTSFDKAKNISSSTVDGISGVFVPELQRGGGVPILVEVEYDCDANFRPFYDESSGGPPSTTVDGKARGSGDNDKVREVPVFQRDGWDIMGRDVWADIDLAPYLHSGMSFGVVPETRTSRL